MIRACGILMTRMDLRSPVNFNLMDFSDSRLFFVASLSPGIYNLAYFQRLTFQNPSALAPFLYALLHCVERRIRNNNEENYAKGFVINAFLDAIL